MPQAIVGIATHHMKLPVRVEVAPSGTAAENVEQEIIIVPRDSKGPLLEAILRENAGTALVFSRTKHGAKKICRGLNIKGYGAAEIHSNRSQGQRKEALDGFKRGKYRILVATDIAARGIDVTDIKMVINYDLPDNSGDYVHRIGRTGRAGKEGKAISFATPDQKGDIRDIERLIRKSLKVTTKGILATPQGAQAQRPPPSAHHPHRGGPPHQGQRPQRNERRGRPNPNPNFNPNNRDISRRPALERPNQPPVGGNDLFKGRRVRSY